MPLLRNGCTYHGIQPTYSLSIFVIVNFSLSAPAKVQARYMRLRLTWQSACIVALATGAVSTKFNELPEAEKATYREKHWFLRYM